MTLHFDEIEFDNGFVHGFAKIIVEVTPKVTTEYFDHAFGRKSWTGLDHVEVEGAQMEVFGQTYPISKDVLYRHVCPHHIEERVLELIEWREYA